MLRYVLGWNVQFMYLVLGNQMVMVVVLNRTDFYVRIFRLADYR